MKKKTMMKSILLTFMMTLTVGVSAQTTWVYTYDAVGNRTQRTVTGSKARQKITICKPKNGYFVSRYR